MAIIDTGRGLGEYPTGPCFDMNRPSWLPYWWDDNAEVECLTKGVTSAGVSTWPLGKPPAPPAPKTEAEMLSWTPDDMFEAQQEEWETWKAGNRATIRTEGPLPPKEPTWFDKYKWYLAAGGMLLLAIKQ